MERPQVSQASPVHTVMVPVTVSGLGPYVPDPPTTLLLDLSLVEEAIHATEEAREVLEDARLRAQQIVDAARAEADRMLSDAKTEAEDLTTAATDEARRVRSEVAAEAKSMRAGHTEEAERLRAETERSLEEIRAAANEDRNLAATELEAARAEVDVIIREAKAAAATLVGDAQESAIRTIHTAQDDAIAEASRIVESARLEAGRIIADAGERIADMQALHEIELATVGEHEGLSAARLVELATALGATPAPLNGRHSEQSRAGADDGDAEPLPELPQRTATVADDAPSPWMIPVAEATEDEDEEREQTEPVSVPDRDDHRSDDAPARSGVEAGSAPRPAQTLIEPLMPAVFRATATDPGRKKRRRK